MSTNINAAPVAPVQKRTDIVQQIVDFGYEIELPSVEKGQRGVFANPNPRNLPDALPERTRVRSIGNAILKGHYDGSDPWEVVLGHSPVLGDLLQVFNNWVGNDKWAWCSNFNGTHGLGNHYHLSLIGDKRIEGQPIRTLDYADWAIAYNVVVTMQPFIAPFLACGKQFRVGALDGDHWANPIVDRVTGGDMKEAFVNGQFRGRLTGQMIRCCHDYASPSLNRKDKPVATIEVRLNEAHPYWAMPGMQLMATLIRASIARNASIKLSKSGETIGLPEHKRVMKEAWENIAANGIYDGMLRTKNITFAAGRGIPHVMRDDQEKTFDMGLDLFRAICRRFANGKDYSALNYGKVMRMYSDFIALWKIPTHLMWDINELYRLLYEVPEAKANQNAWLAYGSKVVLPEGTRASSTNTVTKLINS